MIRSIHLFVLLAALSWGGHVKGTLVSESASARSGAKLSLGLHLEMEPGWHVYWINPGDAGFAPAIAWSQVSGLKADSLQWPTPDTMAVEPLMTYGYGHEVLLPFDAVVEPGAKGQLVLKGKAKWLECLDICVPGKADLELALPVSETSPAPNPVAKPLFDKFRQELPSRETGWSLRAAFTDSFFYLTARSAKTEVPEAPARFFPLDQGLVDNPAPQAWIPTHDGFRLKIKRDAISHRSSDSLRGVMSRPTGWSSGHKGWEIRVPLLPATKLDTAEFRPPSARASTDSGATKGLLLALFFAFLGGLVLNLMPCVLPVLSLKVLDFLKKGGHSRGQAFAHAAVFAAGTILSFLAMAGVLLVLRSGGESLGWGFQMQSPRVVAMLSLLMALLALNLWGVFEPGAAFASRLGGVPGGGWIGSFLTGVTATVVATPCTAPFMGAALGYTLTRPVMETLCVFFSLGLGMSTPYLLLAGFPRLAALLPRPGAWMETLKQFFGFAMAATAVWLAWVVGRLAGTDAVSLLAGLWVVVAIAAWVLGRGALPHFPSLTRWSARLAFFVLVAFSAAVVVVALPRTIEGSAGAAKGALAHGSFGEGTLSELRASGKPWFLYFTADWCLSCQVNERIALERPEVVEAFRKRGVKVVKADWTGRDTLITRTLAGFGRQGVPFYVLSDGKTERFLPELLTPGIVIQAVNGI